MMARITLKEMKISYNTRRCHWITKRVRREKFFDVKIRGLFLMLLNMRSSHFGLLHMRGKRVKKWNNFHFMIGLQMSHLTSHIPFSITLFQHIKISSSPLHDKLFKLLTTFIFSSAHKRSKAFVNDGSTLFPGCALYFHFKWRINREISYDFGINFIFLSLPIKAFDLNFLLSLLLTNTNRTHEFAKKKVITVW